MLWEYIFKYKTPFSLGFCIIFSLTSLIWQKNVFAKGSYYLGSFFEKFSYFIKATTSYPFDFIEKISQLRNLQIQYQKAMEEIENYKSLKEKYEILQEENQKLRQLLEFPVMLEYQEVKAKVLGIRINSITPLIIINKGSQQKIKPYMPVITYINDESNKPIRAVVGITSIVEKNATVVLPIQNPMMKIGVKILGTDQWAVLEGNSYSFNRLKLRYISYLASETNFQIYKDSLNDIQNKKIVTSGNDGVFPPNLAIGKIINQPSSLSREEISTAYVEPYSRLDKLEFVTVILKDPEEWKNYIQNEDFVLPKSPYSEEKVPDELKVIEEKQKIHKKENNKIQDDIEEKIEIPKKQNILNPNDPLFNN